MDQTKKPRNVYVDKPVFGISNPNDPINYILRGTSPDPVAAPQISPEEKEETEFKKAVEAANQMRFEKVRGLMNGATNHMQDEMQGAKPKDVGSFFNTHQNAMNPEIARELRSIEDHGHDSDESYRRWEELTKRFKDDPEQTDILYDYSDLRYPAD